MPNAPDHHEPDLVQLLLLEAGKLMEDTAPEMAMIFPSDPTLRSARVWSLQQMAEDLDAIASAAAVIERRRAEAI